MDGPKTCIHLVRVDLKVMARSQELEFHQQMQFSVILSTPLSEGILDLGKE